MPGWNNRTRDTVLRLLPPYIVTEQHVDEVVDALDRVLTEAWNACKSQPKHGGAH